MAIDTKTLAMLTHLLGIFTSVIGPIVVLLATTDEKVKDHARLALNWQISYLIYAAISTVLMVILIGFVTMVAVSIYSIAVAVIAAVRANDDQLWAYPGAIPFLKVEPGIRRRSVTASARTAQ